MKKLLSVAALMGSSATMICCFLPAAFVTLGFGASFASLVGAFPQITWLSEHKGWIFLVGALLISASGVLQWRARNAACPIDPKLAEGCSTAKGWSRRVFVIAVFFYLLGFTFAFVLPAVMRI